MRAVVDTNVVVSGLISHASAPFRVLDAGAHGRFTWITSEALLSELEGVLRRKKIHRAIGWSDGDRDGFVRTLRVSSVVVSPKRTIEVIADDADNRVLEAAVEGEADYIVSGDSDLVELREYEGTLILTPRQFMAVLDEEEARLL